MREGREERQKAPPDDRLASPEAIIEEHEVQHTHLRSLRGGAHCLRRPRRQHWHRPGAAESDCEKVILARGPTDFQIYS